jgi:hypothetical protein
MVITITHFGMVFARCKAIQRVPIFGHGTFVEFGVPLLAIPTLFLFKIFNTPGIAGCLERHLEKFLTGKVGTAGAKLAARVESGFRA